MAKTLRNGLAKRLGSNISGELGSNDARSPQPFDARGPPSLLLMPHVLVRVPLSKSSVLREIARGRFPAPIRLGDRRVAWLSQEIDAWLEARVTEREGNAEPTKAEPIGAPCGPRQRAELAGAKPEHKAAPSPPDQPRRTKPKGRPRLNRKTPRGGAARIAAETTEIK